MKSKKMDNENDGMPHAAKPCLEAFFLKGFCKNCGWHLRFHTKAASYGSVTVSVERDDDPDASDLIGAIVDEVAGAFGADAPVFDDSGYDGGGGDFGGGGASDGW